jgi:hypothetical protein
MNDSQEPIRRDQLWWKLVRAAQVRSLVTMLSFLPLLLAGAVVAERLQMGVLFPVTALGGSFLVSWLMTRYYCRRVVTCPRCGASLWDCGTGNFKPRRMRIRDRVRECPNCGAPIV